VEGLFRLHQLGDEFIVLDDVQFTKRDWRNRNKLKCPSGACWLSIPVRVTGRYFQKINEAQVADPDWATRHWKTIESLYARAKCFKSHKHRIEELYMRARLDHLTEINKLFLRGILRPAGHKDPNPPTSREFRLADGRTERLLDVCQQLSATSYYCGPRSRGYLEEERFREAGIDVVYMDYGGYPEYPQLFDRSFTSQCDRSDSQHRRRRRNVPEDDRVPKPGQEDGSRKLHIAHRSRRAQALVHLAQHDSIGRRPRRTSRRLSADSLDHPFE